MTDPVDRILNAYAKDYSTAKKHEGVFEECKKLYGEIFQDTTKSDDRTKLEGCTVLAARIKDGVLDAYDQQYLTRYYQFKKDFVADLAGKNGRNPDNARISFLSKGDENIFRLKIHAEYAKEYAGLYTTVAVTEELAKIAEKDPDLKPEVDEALEQIWKPSPYTDAVGVDQMESLLNLFCVESNNLGEEKCDELLMAVRSLATSASSLDIRTKAALVLKHTADRILEKQCEDRQTSLEGSYFMDSAKWFFYEAVDQRLQGVRSLLRGYCMGVARGGYGVCSKDWKAEDLVDSIFEMGVLALQRTWVGLVGDAFEVLQIDTKFKQHEKWSAIAKAAKDDDCRFFSLYDIDEMSPPRARTVLRYLAEENNLSPESVKCLIPFALKYEQENYDPYARFFLAKQAGEKWDAVSKELSREHGRRKTFNKKIAKKIIGKGK